ncbi:MAG TPA: glycosyltransferase family 87 protein [Candidatus Limnocylindria bacterium]
MKADAAHPPRLVWAVGVAVMVLAGLAGLGIFIEKQPYGFDLWAYVLAARHILSGEPLYPPQPQVPAGPLGEYHYAPIVAVPFVLLTPLPFALANAVWIGLNTGLAAAIGVHLIRPLPRDARPWAAAAFVFFLPTILEISLGNLNVLTLALCLLAWSQRARPSVAGTLLAVAIGTKLLPLTLILFYLAAGRGRIVAWTLAVGAAGLLATALVFARDFPAYVAMLIAFKDSHWAAEFIARATPADLAALLNSPLGAPLLAVVSVATATVGGLAARRDRQDETHFHHLALAFAPYLAPFGLLWLPYLIFALPLLASTLHRALFQPRRQTRALLITALGFSWSLMQLVGRQDDITQIAAHFLGLLLLLAVALAVLVFARRKTVSETVAARVPA